MWSKGAVVIVKRGDEAMADALERGLDIRYSDDTSKEQKCKYELMEITRSEKLQRQIEELEEMYGYNWTPPRWAKGMSVFALIIYGISVFIDKYLRIKT